MYSFDEVRHRYDLMQRDEGQVAVKLGRHPNDLMTSFYVRTPSPLLVEYGWGGREVTPAWQPEVTASVGSLWGHQGLFDSLGDGPPPPEARAMPARAARRAPLHVMDGNYTRMSGVCPWWDRVAAGE